MCLVTSCAMHKTFKGLNFVQAPKSSLKMLKEFARLAVEADTPDSPLVFPWSQGPNSTGAASAYASLSDSYLSRPPSQTPSRAPSQGPSPAKRAQHGVPSPGSPPQHARLAAAFAASPSQRAQHDAELSNPYGAATMPSSLDPSLHAQHTQQAVKMFPSTASPLAESSPAAQPHTVDTLTPPTAASSSVEAQSAQSLSKQANHLPEDSSPAAAEHGLQSAQLPDQSPQGTFTPAVQHTQQRQNQALEGPRLHLNASHQPGAMTQDAMGHLLQDSPPQLNTAQGSERLPLSDTPSANGFSNRQSDLVRVASSSSGNGSIGGGSGGGDASSVAADGLRLGIGRVPGSMPSLYTGGALGFVDAKFCAVSALSYSHLTPCSTCTLPYILLYPAMPTPCPTLLYTLSNPAIFTPCRTLPHTLPYTLPHPGTPCRTLSSPAVLFNTRCARPYTLHTLPYLVIQGAVQDRT
jgi:hypothetical protein